MTAHGGLSSGEVLSARILRWPRRRAHRRAKSIERKFSYGFRIVRPVQLFGGGHPGAYDTHASCRYPFRRATVAVPAEKDYSVLPAHFPFDRVGHGDDGRHDDIGHPASYPRSAGITQVRAAGRVPRLGRGGHRQDRPLPALARLHGDSGAHLSAGRRLVGRRGPAADAPRVGALAGRGPAPHAGAQRPDDGPQRGRAAGARGALAPAGRRGRRVRPALPHARRAARLRRGRGDGHRPRLGDERRDLQRPLRPRSRHLEGVLAADRHDHAGGSRHAFPLRFHGDAGTGRDSLDGVLSGRRRGRHHRVRQLRPARRSVVPGLRGRAVRAAGARRIRRRARKADVVPRMGPVPQLRQSGICPGNA